MFDVRSTKVDVRSELKRNGQPKLPKVPRRWVVTPCSALNLLALRRRRLAFTLVAVLVLLPHLLPLLLLFRSQDGFHLRRRVLMQRLELFLLLILRQRTVVLDRLRLLMLLLKDRLQLVLLILREVQL